MSQNQKTLFQAIKDDHDEMYEYHDQYKRARERNDVGAQARWARQLTWEIARHAVGEEIVVYPLMEKYLGQKGTELANHDREEHLKVKDDLYTLEGLKPGSEEFDNLMTRMMDSLRHHNDSEETKDLPMLEPAIGKAMSIETAASFKITKKFVPTRSHPSAPNQPPYETLVGFITAPLDKLKDVFASFPTQGEMEEAKDELATEERDASEGRAPGL